MSDPKGSFDPSAHLSNIPRVGDYLEVKWRLVWLRDQHPDAEIYTELVEHQFDQYAVARAHIKIPNAGSASGYGSETKKGFADYIEKAETKAIGRALAALGFGTQFCDDFQSRVVDSPVKGDDRKRPANQPAKQQGGLTLEQWRPRVRDVFERRDREEIKRLAVDAGQEPWMWMELLKSAPTVEILDWMAAQAKTTGASTSAVDSEYGRAKQRLAKTAAPQGK